MSKARRLSYSSQCNEPLYPNSEDTCHSTRTAKSITESRRSSIADDKPPSLSQRPGIVNAFSFLSVSDLDQFIPNISMFANILDIHSLYKLRLSKSSHKLKKFFGEMAPIDLCTCEIRKEGLTAILQSKVPLCYFLYHLLDEYNSENLFFFLQVEYFEQTFKSLPTDEKKIMARHIYDRFISKNAQFEINVDERAEQSIRKELSCPDRHIFDEAKETVYIFLEASFERFIHSRAFEDMAVHCGEYATYYDKNTTQTAVDYLFNCQKQHDEDDLSFLNSQLQIDNQYFFMNKHHCTLVKSYIQEFVESIFGNEYLEKHEKSSATPKTAYFSSSSSSSSSSFSSSTASNFRNSPKQYFLEKLKLIK